MKVNFKYGMEGLTFELSDTLNFTVLKAKSENTVQNAVETIKNKIENPIGTPSLSKLITQKSPLNKICIVISDSTRPAPSKIMLTAIIEVLKENRSGISMAMIETNGLEHMDPSAKHVFQREVHSLQDFCYRLVFTGRNASQLAPGWTDYF